jgi:polyisoprenoid-binding protein YceI
MSMCKTAGRFPACALIAGWLLWGLAGCQTSPQTVEPAPPVTPVLPEQSGIPAGARQFNVVAEESLLQILVYRGGPMARLGHNHVVASKHLQGTVQLSEDLTRSRFDLRFPVNQLTVDEPAMRELAGADFPPGVPQSAREGTRKNLLSDALLDGAAHPEIRLRAVDVALGTDGGYDVGVEVTLKGRAHIVRVPMKITRSDGELRASGEFKLKQSELGLKPFSVAMGTLVVLDEMTIRLEVVARE